MKTTPTSARRTTKTDIRTHRQTLAFQRSIPLRAHKTETGKIFHE